MEGRGAYNTHAKLPAGGGAIALPHLEAAARNTSLDQTHQPVVIADYGSSTGKNSLVPMRVAIDTLRLRLAADRPILVYHTDLSANDFSALFTLLEADPDRYVLDRPNVFPCGIGRSFYESVLPADYVHLGWCSYAAVWLSCIPARLPRHIFPPRSTGAARATFEEQAAADWESFLALRARELRAGGRMVVVLPAAAENGWTGFENIMDHANAVLAEMVNGGVLAGEEHARMVLGVWARRQRDLVAPFARDGQFRGLIVERCETSALADAAWAAYEQDGNREALASKHAAFFRSTFAPSLSLALGSARDTEACAAFSRRLEHGLQKRLLSAPESINSFVQTIVVAKVG